jgi:hypothetical protein
MSRAKSINDYLNGSIIVIHAHRQVHLVFDLADSELVE